MIPISLKFKGLYSYREEQTVDFDKLTSSQLFGIFGAIGSGKSSILEAIMFSLYDQSDRLNTRDNRYYNMLNLQSNELEIDFTFRSDAREKTKYRVYFRAVRNRNHFDQVNVRSRDFYEWNENAWLPLEVKDASDILDMTYQNFMQTVIIPQGKFREFVDQGVAQRTKMLKELYPLEQFELGRKTGSLLKQTQLAIRGTEERLSEIGAVSEEEIEQGRKEVVMLEKALAEHQQQWQEAEKAWQQQEELRKLFENIQNTEKELTGEEQQKEHFQERERRLMDYNRAITHFKDKLQSMVEIRKDISRLGQSVEKRQKEIVQQEAELKKARKKLADKQEIYDQREQKEQQCQDLEHAIEIRKYKEALKNQEQQLSQARQQTVQIKEQRESLRQQIAAEEDKLALYDKKLKRQPELQQLAHWHETQDSFQQEQKDSQKHEKQYVEELQKILQEKDALLESYDWVKQNDSFEKSRTLLKEQLESYRAKEEKINELIQKLLISEKISSFAESLEDGNECPLCGSTHHPEVVHQESVAQQLKEQRVALKRCKEEEKDLQQLSEKINKLEMDYNSNQQLQNQLTARQKELTEKINTHQQQFCWEEFKKYPLDEIRGFLAKLELLAIETDTLRKKLKEERQQQQKLEEQLEQAQDVHNKAQQEEITLTTSINNHLQLMRLMSYEKLEQYDLPALSQSLEKGQRQLKEAVEEYEKARKSVHSQENTLSAIRSRLEAEQEQLDEKEIKASQLKKDVEQLCQEKKFSNLDEVQALLALDLDAETEQEAINLYKTRLSSLQSQLEKLKKDASGKSYIQSEHLYLQQTLTELKEKVEHGRDTLTLARNRVDELTKKLKYCHDLQHKLGELQKREDNLKELRKLFIGSGFVKYASSVYLDNLCRTANERFMKLTRNNLSLELDEGSEFIVRDYLNNGKTRLLKTLSGGQTFQAALCLALALAENVKTLNQADQSFFFLDEGFGALDRESLRVVFETLKSLRQEKRIVGIISHVEELQQEIDMFLQIDNDKERGSLIKCSWE